MKQAKVELIEKTDKTYTYQNIVFRKYNIKLSSLANLVMYSFPDDKDLTFKKDDTISFDYNQDDNKISKIKKIEKPMYSNFTKDKDVTYINRQDNKEDNIHFQSARRDFAIVNQGRGLSAQEIHEGALEIYRLHKPIKNKL